MLMALWVNYSSEDGKKSKGEIWLPLQASSCTGRQILIPFLGCNFGGEFILIAGASGFSERRAVLLGVTC